MASTGYFGDGPPMRERDFTEAISKRMRVPERLRFGPAGHAHEPEDLSAAYSMHIPDRIALTGIFILLAYKSHHSSINTKIINCMFSPIAFLCNIEHTIIFLSIYGAVVCQFFKKFGVRGITNVMVPTKKLSRKNCFQH